MENAEKKITEKLKTEARTMTVGDVMKGFRIAGAGSNDAVYIHGPSSRPMVIKGMYAPDENTMVIEVE